MSEKFRLDRKIGFRNTFLTKCITVIIDSFGPSIILRSIFIASNSKVQKQQLISGDVWTLLITFANTLYPEWRR